MTFDQCLLSISPKLAKKKKHTVEIWAGSKVGSVVLTLNCIERKLICFPWQHSKGFVLAAAFSLFSQARLCGHYCFQGREAMSKKLVPFCGNEMQSSMLSPKYLLG